MEAEFSFRTRKQSIKRFKEEVFDLLVVGGGITGAAVARDARSRGLTVALVEKNDFAFGTSSRSSKMIHGGLRYLQNFEFGLVFEALSERTLLLETAPHLVKPLPFFLPVFKGDSHGKPLLSLGLWLYDLLALLRSPGFHKNLSKKALLKEIPFLKSEGLRGGFHFFDAWMRDDVLAVETLRSAQAEGAAAANYVEAIRPLWENEQIRGFFVKDLEAPSEEWPLKARRTVICAGPWTDDLGKRMSADWRRWLTPSKGIHLVFDLKKIPITGAMMMSSEQDGRVSFVIPRPDLGAGVAIVGTTDGPTPDNPDEAHVESADVDYLMKLLDKYFPSLKITKDDIISSYVGVRPLMGNEKVPKDSSAQSASVLQKVSREHHIDQGPGGTVLVAGGKYTTHRSMAVEVVDFVLKHHPKQDGAPKSSSTRDPINPRMTHASIEESKAEAKRRNLTLPDSLLERYGFEILECIGKDPANLKDPEGFPYLKAQLKHAIHFEMIMHLEDFYLRRIPLFLARRDHGLPWAEYLAHIWAEELGFSQKEEQAELKRLQKTLAQHGHPI